MRKKIVTQLAYNPGNETTLLLSHVPHKCYCDMVLLYRYCDATSHSFEKYVTNKDLEELGVDFDMFHREALKNSSEIFPLETQTLTAILKENYPGLEFDKEYEVELMIVTNVFEENGANAILYPGVLDGLADYFHGDLYIIPFSIHRVMVMKVPEISCNASFEFGEKIHVIPAEMLSRKVFHYESSTKIFETIKQYKERQ